MEKGLIYGKANVERGDRLSPHLDKREMTVAAEPLLPADAVDNGPVAVDIDTLAREGVRNGALSPHTGEIRLISIADRAGNIRTVDRGPCGDGQIPCSILDLLANGTLIAHNAVFECRWFAEKLGIVPQWVFCTMTASRMLEPLRGLRHGLSNALERHLGIGIEKELGKSDWGTITLTSDQVEYSRTDVRHLHQLADRLRRKLSEAALTHVFRMEMKLIPIVTRMELHGFAIDTARMRGLLQEALGKASVLLAEVCEGFGNPALNPASPGQVVAAFKSKGIFIKDSTEDTLSGLSDSRAGMILAWRREAKLVSMITSLLKAERCGRIHCHFNPTGAVNGRFSSSSQNLQQVNRGELRKCFIPSAADRRLVVADYSQIELRVAALIAGESVMIDAFCRGADLHRTTAALALGKPPAEVIAADRQIAKSANFGLLYGMSAPGFATYARTSYGVTISENEAALLRMRFFNAYPDLRRWHSRCWQKADLGETTSRTVFGRLLLAQGGTNWHRFNLHTALTVSGSCADLLKAAMIKVCAVMPEDARLIATVHDELILDCPADTAEQCRNITESTMKEAFTGMFGDAVPVEVEVKVCANWGEK
jgi:DNA polymerase-1